MVQVLVFILIMVSSWNNNVTPLRNANVIKSFSLRKALKPDIAPKFEKTFPPLEFELKVGYTGFGSVPDLASPVVARYPKEPFSNLQQGF